LIGPRDSYQFVVVAELCMTQLLQCSIEIRFWDRERNHIALFCCSILAIELIEQEKGSTNVSLRRFASSTGNPSNPKTPGHYQLLDSYTLCGRGYKTSLAITSTSQSWYRNAVCVLEVEMITSKSISQIFGVSKLYISLER